MSKISKNIVIVSALYPPEPVVSAQISADLANSLESQGHKVTVLCPFPTRPAGFKFESIFYNRSIDIKVNNNITVVRLPSYVSPESRMFSRLRESFSFGKHSSNYIKKNILQTDIVYANTWPLLGQNILARSLKKYQIPLVLHIQDIYPESLLEKLPKWIKKIIQVPLIYLDKQSVNLASVIIVVSKNMFHFYKENRGIAEKKILLISNWQDESFFVNKKQQNKFIDKSVFTFMYLGNIGPVAGVELLIRSFMKTNSANAQLIIAGSGSHKEGCQKIASKGKNIYFIDIPTGLSAVADMQSKADILLLPVKKNAAMSSVPSKLIAYLFSAKPIIATVDKESDTAKTLIEAKCGWVGEPENEDWLTQQMNNVMHENRILLAKMGESGFNYGIKNFSKREGCKKLSNIILSNLYEYK